MATVLRVTRHPTTEERLAALQNIYGDDVRVVANDVKFFDDSVGAVKAAIEGIEDEVVAVEAIASPPVLAKFLDRRFGLGIPLIRGELARGDDGRPLVVGEDENGRDILAFSHYEEYVEIKVVTRRLG